MIWGLDRKNAELGVCAERRAAFSVGLRRWWELEGDAVGVVLVLGGREVEVGEGDFAGVSGGEIEQGCADDGVVSDFDGVAVFEDESGRFGRGSGGGRVGVVESSGINVSLGRDVGFGAVSAAIEDGGTSLIVGVAGIVVSFVISGVGLVFCGTDVDRVGDGHGHGVNYRRRVGHVAMILGFVPWRPPALSGNVNLKAPVRSQRRFRVDLEVRSPANCRLPASGDSNGKICLMSDSMDSAHTDATVKKVRDENDSIPGGNVLSNTMFSLLGAVSRMQRIRWNLSVRRFVL